MFTIHFINTHDPRRRLIMKLIRLLGHQSLITAVSPEVIDLATFLDIPTDIQESDDHIFIPENSSNLRLSSFFIRRESDVLVSTEVFSEILIDIASGMTVKAAYEKQGFTFH